MDDINDMLTHISSPEYDGKSVILVISKETAGEAFERVREQIQDREFQDFTRFAFNRSLLEAQSSYKVDSMVFVYSNTEQPLKSDVVTATVTTSLTTPTH